MSPEGTDHPGAPDANRPDKRKCPICGKPRAPEYDPFCSKRCADVDLHRWLKGGYTIPGGKTEGLEGEDEE